MFKENKISGQGLFEGGDRTTLSAALQALLNTQNLTHFQTTCCSTFTPQKIQMLHSTDKYLIILILHFNSIFFLFISERSNVISIYDLFLNSELLFLHYKPDIICFRKP